MAAKLSTFPEEIGENFLSCGICLEQYKNAKLLPCLHSFCEPCLGKLAEKSRVIVCPICRRSHDISSSDDIIGRDFFLNDLVNVYNNRNKFAVAGKCELCGQGDKSSHCLECVLDMCEACENGHGVIPYTKSHSLLPMSEYHASKFAERFFVKSAVHCAKHPDYEIEYFCDTCDQAICLKCTALDHPKPEHRYRCVKEAAADYTRELTAMVGEVKVKADEASNGKTAVSQISTSLDARFGREEAKLTEHIRKTTEEITRLIQGNGEKLLKELKDEYDTRKANLGAQLKELEMAEDDLLNAGEYAEKLVHYGSAAHLMTAKKVVSSQMAELLKLETKSDPVEGDFIEFQPRDNFCVEKTLGTINTHISHAVTEYPGFPRVGDDITVTIAAVDKKTQKKVAGRGTIIEAVMTSPVGNVQDVEMTYKKDGAVVVASPARTPGEHELSVAVCKKPVQGSPVKIKVIPQPGLVCSFGERGSGVGQFNYPYGVTLTRSGDALVCDYNNNRMQSFTTGGRHQKVVQINHLANRLRPFDAAVSDKGEIFVTDAGNKQVFVCDGNGKLVRCFGMGKLKTPIGIALSPVNGRVYVVDYSSHCVQVFDQDGNHIKSFGRHGSKKAEFHYPYFACIDDEGNVYVSDSSNDRIQVFNAYGQFLYAFGVKGSGDGQLNCPLGVAVDKRGYVYVSDSRNKRIVKYEKDGTFVCRVDTGTGDGLTNPHGICVTKEEPFGQVIVVDQGQNCVKVFSQ